MNNINELVILTLSFCSLSVSEDTETADVKIDTERPINVVDPRFLSFTLDPKYLLYDDGTYNINLRKRMGMFLSPAYLRIAGPSTKNMTVHNETIMMKAVVSAVSDDVHAKTKKKIRTPGKKSPKNVDLAAQLDDGSKLVEWAKTTGLDLVFALNNEQKTNAGIWDPNTAIDIMTMAEKANVSDVYWQLGYACTNQSIEEYLNDLKTLRVIRDTFKSEMDNTRKWRVVAGDISDCLQWESKKDFEDFMTFSNEMMDAVFLNGNSSTRELERMAPEDRYKLLKQFSVSKTPLWLTEVPTPQNGDLERAVDWMASLGISAKNGFSVYFRDLIEEDLFQPTLSFYMALLYKSLVGEQVLNVEMERSNAILFAHCTSQRRAPTLGSVTLFGANVNDQPATISVKISKKEKAGDIMQYILSNDKSGNIMINGKKMFYQLEIRPTVKRLRPNKTLLITMPPKSIGFWVLHNIKVEACSNLEGNTSISNQVGKTHEIGENKKIQKVSTIEKSENDVDIENDDLFGEIESQEIIIRPKKLVKKSNALRKKIKRSKRQTEEPVLRRKEKKNPKKHLSELNKKQDNKHRSIMMEKLLQLNERLRTAKILRKDKLRRSSKSDKFSKTNSTVNVIKRRRRNLVEQDVSFKKDEIEEDINSEEINKQDLEIASLLRKIQKQLSELPLSEMETKNSLEYITENIPKKSTGFVEMKTKIINDNANIQNKPKTNRGILKSTVEKGFDMVEDINNNFNKLWNILLNLH